MKITSLRVRNATGIALIAIGVVGVPLPLVPGTPMIAAGAALLGPRHPLIVYSKAWLRRRGFLKSKNDPKAEAL
jgi:uncharacterized membrane protein YbaN (DUF454 family)